MNSEELEQSLRTEFESYLKNVVADMRQEVTDFQKMVETEFDKHKSQMDEAFRNFQERFQSDASLDSAFSESVIEHLRLARDEGARITATAIAEAEELEKEQAAAVDSSFVVGEIRDAIKEISSKTTQSAILKSLVAHAAKFTPRGAFFIIKNEHLVGWRVFGNEAAIDDKSVREVFFPTSSETLLSESLRELKTVEGTYNSYSDDSLFLSRLDFGRPDRMYAIPLVVRERAVAVLYADYGNEGSNVNVEALEALVQVAGLTVEISASSRSGKSQQSAEVAHEDEHAVEADSSYESVADEAGYDAPEAESYETAVEETDYEPAQSFTETSYEESAAEESYVSTEDAASVQFESGYGFESEAPVEDEVEESYSEDSEVYEISEPADSSEFETTSGYEFESSESEVEESYSSSWTSDVSEPEEFTTGGSYEQSSSFDEVAEADEFSAPEAAEFEYEGVQTAPTTGVEYETSPSFETTSFESPESFEVEEVVAAAPVAEAEPAVAAPQMRSRLSERNVDLPIEVTEDERRLHNDARRFARLLVSEIKLYNEQKVKEGRDASDLYERLREAIDRSREMYDKRVQPPVASKFDYFHYELVSNLAEGDEAKLGAGYPGTAI